MKKLIKNILVLFVGIMFVISSSGFSIYQHHCNKCNSSEISLFIKNFDCNHNHKACNKTENTCHASKKNHLEHNCCKTQKSFFKIKSDFEKPKINKSIIRIANTLPIIKCFFDVNIEIKKIKPKLKPNFKIPIISGEKLVCLFHQQKIQPPLL